MMFWRKKKKKKIPNICLDSVHDYKSNASINPSGKGKLQCASQSHVYGEQKPNSMPKEVANLMQQPGARPGLGNSGLLP